MQGPYAFINDRSQPYPLLKQRLSLNPHVQTKFDILNQHIRNTVVLPGQLVINAGELVGKVLYQAVED
jgi:hypothetical protein